MKYILAIDQGTTGSRAIVYDRLGCQVASAYWEFRQYFPKPAWVEHDPVEIWDSVRITIDEVLRKVSAQDIAAIGIANQRETTIVWDRKTGQPLGPAIVWQDRRTSARCQELAKDKKTRAMLARRTGLPIDAYFSATKLEWILKNVAGARAKAWAGRLCFGTPDSWVLWNLTGGKVHATDYTNASRTMLFNIKALKWDPDILKLFGVHGDMLPQVKRSSGLFGHTARISRLPAGIPVRGMAGDQQAALFGQACFEPGSLKNTYGTGCFILLNTGRRMITSSNGLVTTLACGPIGEPVYALEGSVFIAGAAIQWLRDGLKMIKSAKESQGLAESLASNEGVYFVPAFVGLGAPYWDQNARGAIFGLTRGTQSRHLVRAALEAMCYQSRDVFEAMEKDSGLKIKELRVDGGACANDFLMRFQADILGVKVIRPRVIETTSLGAAYLAGLSQGFWKNSAQIKRCRQKDSEFKPIMKRSQADKYYAGWLQAVRRTLT